MYLIYFFFSSRRRHTRWNCDWSSDVCSSDLKDRGLAQQLLNAIFIGSIYALFAVGYTLVFGVLDVLNLAHSAVFMLGAVVTYSLVALHGIPFLPAAVIAILVCGMLGLLIEFVALRPLRRRDTAGDQRRSDLRLDAVRIFDAGRPRRSALWPGDFRRQPIHRP